MTDGRRTQKRIFPGRPVRPRGSRQEQDKKGGVSRSVGSTGNPDKNVCGGVLLSHTLPGAVPSPCQALASGFGKGPGVTPGPWPPQKPPSTARTPKKTGTPTGQKENHPRAATGACRDGPGTGQRTRTPFRDHRNNAPCRQQSRSSKDADPPPHTGGNGLLCRRRPLVPVGSTPRGASTSGLSNTCSTCGLQDPEGPKES